MFFFLINMACLRVTLVSVLVLIGSVACESSDSKLLLDKELSKNIYKNFNKIAITRNESFNDTHNVTLNNVSDFNDDLTNEETEIRELIDVSETTEGLVTSLEPGKSVGNERASPTVPQTVPQTVPSTTSTLAPTIAPPSTRESWILKITRTSTTKPQWIVSSSEPSDRPETKDIFVNSRSYIAGSSTDESVTQYVADGDVNDFSFDQPPVLWFDQIEQFPLLFARSIAVKSRACAADLNRFLDSLKNGTLWASEMYDASTKHPNGVLGGRTRDLGNYFECTQVHHDTLRGKYCMVNIGVSLGNVTWLHQEPFFERFDPELSAWELVHYRGNAIKVRKDWISVALCVPSSCDRDDVESVISHELDPIRKRYNLALRVHVPPLTCHLRVDNGLSLEAQIFVYVALFLIALTITCGIYDYSTDLNKRKPENVVEKIAWIFSWVRNTQQLIRCDNEKNRDLDCLHGAKVILILFIIFGHRYYMTYFGSALSSSYNIENLYRNYFMHIFIDGLIVVDIFFFITALLITYRVLEEYEKRRYFNVIGYVLLRMVRLTPSYMCVVAFNATLLYYTSAGPFWEKMVGTERERCQETWWLSLLYLNNYVRPEKMCMFTSWYLSCDLQMCVIGICLLYLIVKNKYVGYTALVAATILSILVPFFVLYNDDADVTFKIVPNMKDARQEDYFLNYYIKTHMRMIPYMIGIVMGIVMFKMKNSKYQLGKVPSSLLIVLFIAMAFGTPGTYLKFYLPELTFTKLDKAFYNGAVRIVYTLAYCMVFLVAAKSKLTWQRQFLGGKLMKILSRLVYGAYLIHYVFQIIDIASMTEPNHFVKYQVGLKWTGDNFIAFVLAYFLFLLVDCPASNIIKSFR